MTERYLSTPIMHRVVVHQGLVFVGGTTCDDESLDLRGQTEQILAKLDGYLAAAASHKGKLLAATIYLTDLARKPELDAAWKAWLPASPFPVRATVGVADLGGDARVEIAITAHQ